MSDEPNTYPLGTTVTVKADFSVRQGEGYVPANPTSCVVTVRDPDGVESSPAPTPGETGEQFADVLADKPGRWRYRFQGTGAAAAQNERSFLVEETDF